MLSLSKPQSTLNPGMCIAEYIFYPVGQGLFASGTLKTRNDNPLIWVYDCGSLEGDKVLSPQIADFKFVLEKNNDNIDLLALSHFDKDHKNGIVQLLDGCNVGTILLPYLNDIEKNLYIYALMEQAISDDVDIDDVIDEDTLFFIRDPNFYLSKKYSNKIKSILFVLPHDHPTVTNADNSLSQEKGNISEFFQKLKLFHRNGNKRKSFQKLKWQTTNWYDNCCKGNIPISYLISGTSIKYKTFWEFFPYNDTNVSQPFHRDGSEADSRLRYLPILLGLARF